jgi:hypothetical protein
MKESFILPLRRRRKNIFFAFTRVVVFRSVCVHFFSGCIKTTSEFTHFFKCTFVFRQAAPTPALEKNTDFPSSPFRFNIGASRRL